MATRKGKDPSTYRQSLRLRAAQVEVAEAEAGHCLQRGEPHGLGLRIRV